MGTFALRFWCSGGVNNRQFQLFALGSGGAQIAGVKGIDDDPSNALRFTAGNGLSTGYFSTIATIGVNAPNGGATFPHFYRLGGTLVLHNNLRNVTLVYECSSTTATTPGPVHSVGRRCLRGCSDLSA